MMGMRARPLRSPRWAAAAACFAAVSAGCLAGCDVGGAAREPTDVSRPTLGAPGTTVRVLQMNLCNSGRAGCYSHGRAVTLAAALVHEHQPEMVSLNEVCRGDLRPLEQALSAGFPKAAVATAFAPAKDRQTQAPVRCQNGQEFGDGVLLVVARPEGGARTDSGLYPAQDLQDTEERVWVCIHLAAGLSACTTHTSSTDAAVALKQCRYLLDSVVPMISRRGGVGPIIIGADLNLAARGSPSPQSCVPSGYQRTDDGGLQDVVVGPGLRVRGHWVLDMHGTTDHPGLLVDVDLRPPSVG